MNLLELVNYARSECGAGSDLTSLTGVTGDSLRFKNWVIREWEEIQKKHRDWRWMMAAYSFTSTANSGSYTPAQAGISTRFGMWDRNFCTVYLTATGVSDQSEVYFLDFNSFRQMYLLGAQTSQRPIHFTIGGNNELLLAPKPESTLYTITGNYYKGVQTLSANSDIPELPEQHEVIAYGAMMRFGRYKAAPEIYTDASGRMRKIMKQLTAVYLPEMMLGKPLA